MCLIAITLSWQLPLVILQVALGIGAVIFVHELGHFAVAKMCGVKCDKFFIGFDVGGYKISRKWGETEYGIGILPLGGYVKMLGQDDNPANIAEQVRESEVQEGEDIATKEIVGPNGETFVVDRRSYIAKSVPQRMAIISAGVIMNVIFAFIFAVIAYGWGVPIVPCVVSQVAPGSAAYVADIRPGDEVIALDDIEDPSFTDLMQNVTLGDLEKGIDFQVRRAATGEIETINLRPEKGSRSLARVGIASPSILRLSEKKPAVKGTAAATAGFEGNDEIVAVNGEPISGHHQWKAQLIQNIDQPLEVQVRRGGTVPAGNLFGKLEGGNLVTLTLQPQKRYRLGLKMAIGKIVAVQKNSPAADKGLKAGDFIDKISYAEDSPTNTALNNDDFDDPVALPAKLNALAKDNRTIRLSIRRSESGDEGQQTNEEIDIPLRKVTWEESSLGKDDPISAPALGISYSVLNRVRSVVPDSPAAKAGLLGTDVITQVEFLYPKEYEDEIQSNEPLLFSDEGNRNWPLFMRILQRVPVGTEIKLTYKRGSEKEPSTATLKPELVDDQFTVSRGLRFLTAKRMKIAKDFNEQIQLGFLETKKSLGTVFRFLRKIGTQVPISALGGPVTIAAAAGNSAYEGGGALLVFLTMLSANLAIINFLPIPLLDGGHMVFLAWEGIRGRPASEKFVVALHVMGFVCIISLMVFVLGLDVGLIPRNL